MAVLTDLLEWSAGRPAWQRDALRRIITQENLAEEDVAELLAICLADHGMSDPEIPVPAPQPLAAEHLPPSENIDERVQLIGIREVEGVNALAAGQQIHFQPDSMTIVFGYNGSGKSGYARILRALCHARYRGDRILQNAFANNDQPTPSATVDFRVGNVDRTEIWQQGLFPPSNLGRVSFFDADCAAVHVDDANELAFTPFGLDVLPKLVTVCQQIHESIDRLIQEQERNRPISLVNPGAAEGTEIRAILEQLNEDSDLDDFRLLSLLSEHELNRIVELREALGVDPATRARDLQNTITRLRRLQQNLQDVANALSPDSIEVIRLKLQDLITKKAAAKTAAEEAFTGQPLSGVGEEVWQQLWEAARNYSQKQAYPGQEFPFTGDDSRCVLCQQPLDRDARERLVAFEKFIKAETQQAAEQAEVVLVQALESIKQLVSGLAAYRDYLSDLPEDEHELRRSIRRFFRVAWKVRQKILQSCVDMQWHTPCDFTPTPAPELEAKIEGMLRRTEELERAATTEERQTLLDEQNRLLARQWLGSILDDVETEIARRKNLAILNRAISDTVTTGITRKNGELTNTYVTDILRNRFIEEIRSLGAEYLQVGLEAPGGRLGQQRFRVVLQGTQDNTLVRNILSEGEFRCIALAGFLAELSTEQSGSALIFDDPVSSLDHQWRRKVAYRLVQLAAERQVIIFTHDIVFLADLVGYSTRQGIPLRQSYLYRGPDQPGECIDGLPWAAMKVRDRIGRLRDWLQTAEATFRRQGIEAYEPEARRIYGLLRETWERAVEELLLNGVVIRFDHAIHTQQLRRLSDITDADIQTINDAMTKSSRFLEGHDEAQAVADPVPGPDELRQDITDLENWVIQIRPRRN